MSLIQRQEHGKVVQIRRCSGVYPHVWDGVNCGACMGRSPMKRESFFVRAWRHFLWWVLK